MPRYWYTLQHKDDKGREWAARLDFDEASTARKAHRLSCDFMWVTSTMRLPFVSSLMASDDRTQVEIRPSCTPGQDPDREYVVADCPPEIREQLRLGTIGGEGRDMASSRDRAEAQPDDLGSSPSASTDDLPF